MGNIINAWIVQLLIDRRHGIGRRKGFLVGKTLSQVAYFSTNAYFIFNPTLFKRSGNKQNIEICGWP